MPMHRCHINRFCGVAICVWGRLENMISCSAIFRGLAYRVLDKARISSLCCVFSACGGNVTALNGFDGLPSIKSFKYIWWLGRLTRSVSSKTGRNSTGSES